MSRLISLFFFGCSSILTLLLLPHCSNTECQFDADCPKRSSVQYQCQDGLCVEKATIKVDGGAGTEQKDKECQSGFKRKCYSGSKSTQDVGVCQSGEQVCVDGKWSACKKEVTPSKEDCTNDLDDNCNGIINEGCSCKNKGETRDCYKGPKGTEKKLPCHPGKQICQNDKTWSATCEQQALPKKESCNGLDDDCDGKIDEECPCKAGNTRPCYTSFQTKTPGVGLCKEGMMTCRENLAWGNCVGAIGPQDKEICNGKDDNCDGTIDEGCDCKPGETQECYTGPQGTLGKGICSKGRQACNEKGRWGACLDQKTPQQQELCNGKDDDCDGQVDEQLRTPKCGLQKGICAGAKRPCGGIKGWLPCTPRVYQVLSPSYEEDETKCDNIDNDCDGQVDEKINKPCFSEVQGCQKSSQGFGCEGNCRTGNQTCKAGHWSTCNGEVLPAKETCNGSDDDCDGIIDNGCQCKLGAQQDCYSGPKNTAGKGNCKKGKQTCVNPGRWGVCQGDTTPGKETCNGKDDDCNGTIDDELVKVCYTGTPGTAGVGPCQKGQSICQNGKYSTCLNESLPKTEKCDNKIDDDCDGKIDETDGRALLFSGKAQRVEIPHHDKLNLKGSFTIELWYYLEKLGSKNVALLINKHKSGDNKNGYHIKLQQENTTYPQCGLSWWNANGGHQLLFGSCPIKVWTHIALVYDKGTKMYHFYMNGKETNKGTATIEIVANQYPLLFGTESSPTADVHFQGQIASVRISNNTRYTTGFSTPCTFKLEAVTVGLWNLDDGNGKLILDRSANKLHGKILGPTWSLGRQCNASKHGGCKL